MTRTDRQAYPLLPTGLPHDLDPTALRAHIPAQTRSTRPFGTAAAPTGFLSTCWTRARPPGLMLARLVEHSLARSSTVPMRSLLGLYSFLEVPSVPLVNSLPRPVRMLAVCVFHLSYLRICLWGGDSVFGFSASAWHTSFILTYYTTRSRYWAEFS
jgi:hypothetical protein